MAEIETLRGDCNELKISIQISMMKHFLRESTASQTSLQRFLSLKALSAGAPAIRPAFEADILYHPMS
jgi:hypothetical protein